MKNDDKLKLTKQTDVTQAPFVYLQQLYELEFSLFSHWSKRDAQKKWHLKYLSFIGVNGTQHSY